LGVLGGINEAKGGSVLKALSTHQRQRRIVIIGEMDQRFHLPKPHTLHGKYDRKQISDLAQEYDIGAWLIPSVWPETFSFTTHEALATGLPVMVFPLGAQAEAATKAANGFVLSTPFQDTSQLWQEIEKAFKPRQSDPFLHHNPTVAAKALPLG
jgi:hypothetical protein